MINCSFDVIKSSWAFLFLDLSYNDLTFQPKVVVKNCSFSNMTSDGEDGSILYDVSHTSSTLIADTVIYHSLGYFYYSAHSLPSEITLNDSFLSTSALSTVTNESNSENVEQYGIFAFDAVDAVSINNLVVDYSYDMDNCEYSSSEENEQIEDGSAKRFQCTNPLILIDNYGQIEMRNAQINTNFVNTPKHSDSTYDVFSYSDNGEGFINNFGVLNIHDITLEEPLAYSFILNAGQLSVSGLSFNWSELTAHGLAKLHSHVIIDQRGSNIAETALFDCDFKGSTYAVLVSGGTFSVNQSRFELSTIPIEAQLADSVVIANSVFGDFGLYSGTYPDYDYDPSGIRLKSIGNVVINNCSFSG